MGEAVADRAGQRRPSRGRRGNLDRLVERPRFAAPRRRRNFDHAAEQALLRAAAQQHRAVAASEPERNAIAQRPLRLLGPRRDCVGEARAAAAQQSRHGQRTQRGRRGVQIVAPRSIKRLREIAGSLIRHQRRGERPEARLCRRKRVRSRHKAGRRPVRHCRRSRRSADRTRSRRSPPRCKSPIPGSARNAAGSSGKPAVMPLDNGARAGVQVAGARVIAEPLPQLQHLVERCRGERRNIGPACHELVEIWADSRYGRLLQHDLAEPDAVGVGSDAGRGAPRQRAAVAVVPNQKRCGIGGAR